MRTNRTPSAAALSALALMMVGAPAHAAPGPGIDLDALRDALRRDRAIDIRDAAVNMPDVPELLTSFSRAKLYFEENTTDEDLGLHIALDGEDWLRVQVYSHEFRRLYDFVGRGPVRQVGLTELFSESAEPGYIEFPRDEFLDLFPPGTYVFVGMTVDHEWIVSEAELTHNIPEGPVDLLPGEDAEVDASMPLVVEWEPVEDPDAPESVIIGYQVQVILDTEGEPARTLQVDLGPDATSFTVAPGWLEPGKDYKYEIIAIESSDNQALVEIEFSTMGDELRFPMLPARAR